MRRKPAANPNHRDTSNLRIRALRQPTSIDTAIGRMGIGNRHDLLREWGTGHSEWDAERAGAGGSEVINTGAQKCVALGNVDFLVDLQSASLHIGVILGRDTDFGG